MIKPSELGVILLQLCEKVDLDTPEVEALRATVKKKELGVEPEEITEPE